MFGGQDDHREPDAHFHPRATPPALGAEPANVRKHDADSGVGPRTTDIVTGRAQNQPWSHKKEWRSAHGDSVTEASSLARARTGATVGSLWVDGEAQRALEARERGSTRLNQHSRTLRGSSVVGGEGRSVHYGNTLSRPDTRYGRNKGATQGGLRLPPPSGAPRSEMGSAAPESQGD